MKVMGRRKGQHNRLGWKACVPGYDEHTMPDQYKKPWLPQQGIPFLTPSAL